MIRVENLEFTYPKGNKNAVDGFTFDVKNGEFFGFLGSNCAGKTSTLNLIIGLFKGCRGRMEMLLP